MSLKFETFFNLKYLNICSDFIYGTYRPRDFNRKRNEYHTNFATSFDDEFFKSDQPNTYLEQAKNVMKTEAYQDTSFFADPYETTADYSVKQNENGYSTSEETEFQPSAPPPQTTNYNTANYNHESKCLVMTTNIFHFLITNVRHDR